MGSPSEGRFPADIRYDNTMSETIGFVGLGSMGIGMARNLLARGYSLRVYNRTTAKAEQLAQEGAVTVCATPAEAASGVNAVVSMLADDKAVEQVTAGDDGIIAGLAEGGAHLSASTISPEISRRLAVLHREQSGSHYLATPVFGRPTAAASALLHVLLSGGNAALRTVVRPILEAMGQSVWDFGDDPGAANVVKVCGNFLVFAATEAMAEAFTLAEKNGVDRVRIFEMLTGTLFANPVFQGYGRMVATEQYEPVGFSLPLALKDVRLAEDLGRTGLSPLPIADLLDQKIVAALAKGYGHLDAAVFAHESSEAAGLRVGKPTASPVD